MKKKFASLFMALVMAVGIVPVFGVGAAAADEIPAVEAVGAGKLSVSNLGTDTVYRLVFPDGTKTSWNVRGEYDDDFAVIEPLDGGDYYLEVCPLSALTVLDEEEEYPPYRYDLWTEVSADRIRTSETVTVAQAADEGDNIVDIAEGEVLLAPSYNDYAAFVKENDLTDSDFDFTEVAAGPAVKYVSADDGTTWKKLTGDITITSSTAEPVANGVSYAHYCGAGTTTITLDNINTTGTILGAAFCHTVVKIKGDVTVKRMDTEQLGTTTVVGADSDARLTVTRAISGCCLEIKDLAELKIEGTRIAINNIMGDLKLTNIGKMDIKATSTAYTSGICNYYGNVIFTEVFGTVELPNDPEGVAVEAGTDQKIIVNTDGAYVYAGADRAGLRAVTPEAEGALAGNTVPACFAISATELAASNAYDTCPKDGTCPIRNFTDADAAAWYHDGVHYCMDNGIMEGCGNGIFAPEGIVTREQVWMTLARISGEEPADMAAAKVWAVESGVSDGTNPTNAVTREQFITMLHRYAGSKGYDVSVGEDTNILSYNDAFDIAEYAIPAVQWGCGSGVMEGCGDGMLMPAATTTRAQLAVFLQRFCETAAK